VLILYLVKKSNENEVKYIDLRRKIMFRICSEFSVMFRICSEFSAIFRIFRICSEFSVMFRIFSKFLVIFRIFRHFRISSTKTGLFRIS
jgi:hypothetical protein